MTWRRATRIFLVSIPVVIGGYDLCAFWWGGDEATLSRAMLSLCGPATLAVVFAWGVLVGHLFLRQNPDAARDKIPGRLQ